MAEPRLGIIGGSGLYALDNLTEIEDFEVDTPFGSPSDTIRIGTLSGHRVAFLSRHGSGHRLSPSEVPYAANICAMKMLGVQDLVSISAVGSLREDIAPRSFVVPDNGIDRTIGRQRTFFENGVVGHVSIAYPFCPTLASAVAGAAESGGLPVHSGGTYLSIEGPQFSTRAESELYRSWGASIIGMTAFPEIRLAREAELCYACLAMVTDYDVWHEEEEHVSVEGVVANLVAMTEAVQTIVTRLADTAPEQCQNGCRTALANAIITDRSQIPPEMFDRLQPIAGKYLNEAGAQG